MKKLISLLLGLTLVFLVFMQTPVSADVQRQSTVTSVVNPRDCNVKLDVMTDLGSFSNQVRSSQIAPGADNPNIASSSTLLYIEEVDRKAERLFGYEGRIGLFRAGTYPQDHIIANTVPSENAKLVIPKYGCDFTREVQEVELVPVRGTAVIVPNQNFYEANVTITATLKQEILCGDVEGYALCLASYELLNPQCSASHPYCPGPNSLSYPNYFSYETVQRSSVINMSDRTYDRWPSQKGQDRGVGISHCRFILQMNEYGVFTPPLTTVDCPTVEELVHIQFPNSKVLYLVKRFDSRSKLIIKMN